ncbi:LysR family transcriptional regulator [Deinococcus sp. Arct2-2]|uniref:LysR family transcriptional regulator n=1 Tax=Deinococcus sp. Arct2-2 TaxID=2568653 RepID=UPI0010A4A5ED|nr:LysR substrate-binding domain-containing protein [Deinococcus sp. Arct2-2]THF67873.1 LysR family transcriptional regulator [Deinococcus sp. Arct2-2]
MLQHGMELRHVRAFVAVAEERNFTRAAARVFLSQPAFSRVIQQLEGELGTRLLDRTSRVVTLTDAGRAFLQHAQNVLTELELATSELLSAAGQAKLRVGFPQYATYGLIPEVLAKFADLFPTLGVEQHELFSDQQLTKLLANELDIGFVRTPHHQPEIEYLPFVTEEVWAMLPEDHPLTAQAELRLIDLRNERLLLPSRTLSARFHDYVLSCCRQAGFVPQVLTMEGKAA